MARWTRATKRGDASSWPDTLTQAPRLPWPVSSQRLSCAHLVEHPRTDVEDEPAVLGRTEERAGPEHPLVGVRDPQERFGADGPAGVEVDDGLVQQAEAVVVEGVAQRPLGLVPLDLLEPDLVVEQLVAVAPGVLGAVHGDIGVAQSWSPVAYSVLPITTPTPR